MNHRRKAWTCIHGCIVLILFSSILSETSVVEVAGSTSLADGIRVRDADLSGDGIVDKQDFVMIVEYFGSRPDDVRWNPKADLNEDGSGNILDLILAANMFGKKRVLANVVAFVSTFSDESVEFIASNFDMVVTGFNTGFTIGKIKALNPNIIVLGYRDIIAMHTHYDDWQEADLHEDWFLHDVHGERLIHEKWGWHCMDISSEGWRQHYANYVKEEIELFGFDGVFADDAWTHLFRDAWTVPSEHVPDWNYELNEYTHWQEQIRSFLSYVKSRIDDKLLIYNGPSQIYLDVADGQMRENFVTHPNRSHIDEINTLATVTAAGKYFLAASAHGVGEDTEPLMEYCLSCFLLGVSGPKAYFSWRNIWSEPSHGYYPEFDVSLGSPVEGYYSIDQVYARDFTDGKVLVNLTETSYTVSLGENYRTLDGEIVSTITLAAHTAMILLRM